MRSRQWFRADRGGVVQRALTNLWSFGAGLREPIADCCSTVRAQEGPYLACSRSLGPACLGFLVLCSRLDFGELEDSYKCQLKRRQARRLFTEVGELGTALLAIVASLQVVVPDCKGRGKQ